MFAEFRNRYPQASLTAKLIEFAQGKYMVKASVRHNGQILATGLGAAETLEGAEDRARWRALEALGLFEMRPGLGAGLADRGQAHLLSVESAAIDPAPLAPLLTASPVEPRQIRPGQGSSRVNPHQPVVETSYPYTANQTANQPPIDRVGPTTGSTPQAQTNPPENDYPENDYDDLYEDGLDNGVEHWVDEGGHDASSYEANDYNDGGDDRGSNTARPQAISPAPDQAQSAVLSQAEPDTAPAIGQPDAIGPDKPSQAAEQSGRSPQRSRRTSTPSPRPGTKTVPADSGTVAATLHQTQHADRQAPKTAEGPIDLSDAIAQIDILMKRLNWTKAQGIDHLAQTYGKRTRAQLTDTELLDFLQHLQALADEPDF